MKDSQPSASDRFSASKYIKVNNERFSTTLPNRLDDR